jgi:2-polyprenyl-3-methyl-5-hydroxy-6-metoxy-1,4-benzoquinol methylase
MARDDPYAGKPGTYFHAVRAEIAPQLPAQHGAVLELGCGSGATLAWLKAEHGFRETVGIELFADAAAHAATRVDRVIQGDIERMQLDLPAGHFDLILCMDVLEHLVDPWAAMDRLAALLKPGGRLIASIPNVRNWRALLPLLFAAKWEYQRAGILDRTHLRFFTRRSAVALVAGGGLTVKTVRRLPLAGPGKARLANLVTLGLLRDFLTLQFLVCADKA